MKTIAGSNPLLYKSNGRICFIRTLAAESLTNLIEQSGINNSLSGTLTFRFENNYLLSVQDFLYINIDNEGLMKLTVTFKPENLNVYLFSPERLSGFKDSFLVLISTLSKLFQATISNTQALYRMSKHLLFLSTCYNVLIKHFKPITVTFGYYTTFAIESESNALRVKEIDDYRFNKESRLIDFSTEHLLLINVGSNIETASDVEEFIYKHQVINKINNNLLKTMFF